MSDRETVGLRDIRGDFGGVDNRVADSSVRAEMFQLIEGVIPWQGEHRRMFGKKAFGKFHGASVDNLAVITIHAIPGPHTIYQTREGLFMDGQ